MSDRQRGEEIRCRFTQVDVQLRLFPYSAAFQPAPTSKKLTWSSTESSSVRTEPSAEASLQGRRGLQVALERPTCAVLLADWLDFPLFCYHMSPAPAHLFSTTVAWCQDTCSGTVCAVCSRAAAVCAGLPPPSARGGVRPCRLLGRLRTSTDRAGASDLRKAAALRACGLQGASRCRRSARAAALAATGCTDAVNIMAGARWGWGAQHQRVCEVSGLRRCRRALRAVLMH